MSDPTLELTKALIERPSLTPDDQGCQDMMIARLEAIGFQVERLRFDDVDNFWATRGSGKPSYQINSELYDFLYTIMDSTHREIAHGKVGLCIEEKFKDSIHEKIFDLFFHFTIAKDFERIAKYGILAAELSEGMSAPHEVLSYYSQSLSALKVLTDSDKIL